MMKLAAHRRSCLLEIRRDAGATFGQLAAIARQLLVEAQDSVASLRVVADLAEDCGDAGTATALRNLVSTF